MRKKRTYSPRALKSNYSYTLEQLADLYDLDIATPRRWVRDEGLVRVPAPLRQRRTRRAGDP